MGQDAGGGEWWPAPWGGGGGRVESRGGSSGQISSTRQGAWSRMNRVVRPMLRGPSRVWSPSRARISMPALAQAATTSRSGRPHRACRPVGRPRRACAASRRACWAASRLSVSGPVSGREATAQQACPSTRQGVQTFGVNDMEQLDAGGGLVADGIDACLPRAFSEPDHDLHLRALLTTWLRLADQATVPLHPRARRRAPSPHPAAGTPGSLADGRGSAKPAAKAAWPVSQRMSGWGRR